MFKILEKPTPTIMQQQYGNYGFIKIEDIVYISLQENHTELNMVDCSTIKSREKLVKYYDHLKAHSFHYANRHHIFNLRYLKKLYENKLLLQNGKELKLSRIKRKELLEELGKLG